MLIDSGLSVADIHTVVDDLTRLLVTVLTTHAHWDHIGGHGLFDAFAVHPAERAWPAGAFPHPLSVVKRNLLREPCAFPAGFDADAYRLFQGEPQRLLQDGACIELGGRSRRVLHTPGHSPGHHALAVPRRFAGRVAAAFGQLEQSGQLTQGGGIFDFGDFHLHL